VCVSRLRVSLLERLQNGEEEGGGLDPTIQIRRDALVSKNVCAGGGGPARPDEEREEGWRDERREPGLGFRV